MPSNEQSQYSACISYVHGNECIVENVLNKAAADTVLFVKVEVSNSLGNRASSELVLQLLNISKYHSFFIAAVLYLTFMQDKKQIYITYVSYLVFFA
jgi:hypothetical protein